jgi:hypothetical protein
MNSLAADAARLQSGSPSSLGNFSRNYIYLICAAAKMVVSNMNPIIFAASLLADQESRACLFSVDNKKRGAKGASFFKSGVLADVFAERFLLLQNTGHVV